MTGPPPDPPMARSGGRDHLVHDEGEFADLPEAFEFPAIDLRMLWHPALLRVVLGLSIAL